MASAVYGVFSQATQLWASRWTWTWTWIITRQLQEASKSRTSGSIKPKQYPFVKMGPCRSRTRAHHHHFIAHSLTYRQRPRLNFMTGQGHNMFPGLPKGAKAMPKAKHPRLRLVLLCASTITTTTTTPLTTRRYTTSRPTPTIQ